MLGSIVASATALETIDERMLRCGISRRSFLVFCSTLMIAAPYGLAITDKRTPEDVAAGLGKVTRPPIIWLHFQDCTGCTESLLQTSHPDFGDLILNVISLEYHETLMAGSGLQARQALDEAVQKHVGKFVLVVEGSIPTKDQGIYMKLAGRPALDVLADMHLAPRGDSQDMHDSNPPATFGYVARELGRRGLGFLFAREYFGPDRLGPQLKKQFGGVYIANERYTLAQANHVIQEGEADAVAFGRLFIANPDLPARFTSNASLNAPDPSTFFTSGPHGYTDYHLLSV